MDGKLETGVKPAFPAKGVGHRCQQSPPNGVAVGVSAQSTKAEADLLARDDAAIVDKNDITDGVRKVGESKHGIFAAAVQV